MNIGILDYNACNISSIYFSIYRLGLNPIIIKDKKNLKDIDKLIIPGVGAAKRCIDYINKNGMMNEIENFLLSKKPILGICLGLQIFSKKLFEHGVSEGIGLIDAEVIPISNSNSNLYNIGWSNIIIKSGNNIPQNLIGTNSFYFCHSYYLKFGSDIEKKNCLGFANFNIKIPSLIIKDNFMGTQFHPEKSQNNGLNLIKYFLDWSPK